MQEGLDTLATSGIVGLSPNGNESMGDLFIIKMRDSGVIKKAIFSLMIELINNNSKMTFGGIDLENMAALGSVIQYHPIVNNTIHWTLILEKMTLSSSTLKNPMLSNYEFGKNKSIIVDSGTSFLLMPQEDRDEFI